MNPRIKWALILGGVAILILATPAIAVGIANLLGFSVIGPVAASAAAGAQASIGAVSAGSLFALLQSLTMGGAVLATAQSIANVLGLVTFGAAIGLGFFG